MGMTVVPGLIPTVIVAHTQNNVGTVVRDRSRRGSDDESDDSERLQDGAPRVSRMMHKKTLRCEEVRLDGKTGGFDELRFYVMCKFLIARPVANKGHFSFILQYVIVL